MGEARAREKVGVPIIPDEGYAAYMVGTVEPYLAARCKVRMIDSVHDAMSAGRDVPQGTSHVSDVGAIQTADSASDGGTAHTADSSSDGGSEQTAASSSADGAARQIYCEFFDCDAPRGTVLISHGFTETAKKFHEVAWMFLHGGYNVCAIEHCGHGRTYRLVDGDPSLVHVDSYTRYTDDLFLAAREAQNRWEGLSLILYAHSMGGGIGASLAGLHPELFEKVILNAPMIRPLTAGVPWGATKVLTGFFCKIGKSESYVMGKRPFIPGSEKFEDSAGTSRERFDYYQDIRETDPLFQMNAPTYSWLREAGRMNRYLMGEGAASIACPVLLLQAENDAFVSNEEEERFVAKLKERPLGDEGVTLVPIAGSRHEIYRSTSDVLEAYWKTIWDFLDN